ATDRDPNLIDSTVAGNLMPASFAPFNRYSWYFPVITDRLRYDQVVVPSFVIAPTGALVQVRFAAQTSGELPRAACIPGTDRRPIRVLLNHRIRSAGSMD